VLEVGLIFRVNCADCRLAIVAPFSAWLFQIRSIAVSERIVFRCSLAV